MATHGSNQQNPTYAAGVSQSAPPVASGAILGSSAPLQMDQSGSVPKVNTPYALDSRDEKPSTWNEVYLLQEALKPSIRSFTRITARSPPVVSGSEWLSYADQLAILQRESDRCWNADGRAGPPPKLAKLGEWRGGILLINGAEYRITEDMTEKFTHRKVSGNRHPDGSLGWFQTTFSEQAHNEMERMLSAADAQRERLRLQTVEGEEEENLSEIMTRVLDDIVTRDPERYLAWLSSMGYFHFTTIEHNPYSLSWEDWCTWKAPRVFEIYCKQVSVVMRSPFGPGAIDRTKYGPPGDRPTITLDQAKKGNRRALEFCEGHDGLEVSLKEKPQYHMIGGEATSRETAAHYHATRGEDVWLFEPTDSFMAANNDPGRQREAEVEASFGCHRQ